MRAIYLVRHGQAGDGRKSCCLGRTDLPLNETGKREGEKLKLWFAGHPVERIVSSPLSRCIQTGERIAGTAGRLETDRDLIEIDGGRWENLPFDEIKKQFPREYEERGKCLGMIPPPGGESFYQGGIRLYDAIQRLLKNTAGDIAVVSHSGVIRGLVCIMMHGDPAKIMDIPQPTGGITRIWAGEKGELFVNGQDVGIRPALFPDEEERRNLEEKRELPSNIRIHEEAVAALAYRWALELKEQGWEIDPELTRSAALLHDIARLGPDHGERGGDMLRKEGYPSVAHIIRSHHRLIYGEEYRLTEASLVFLADKRMLGDREVSLRERFERSAAKCRTAEGKFSHQLQYRQAVTVQRNLSTLVEGLTEEWPGCRAGG